jgi:ferrochelatase
VTQGKIGVLVMSYGTPESMDQIEAYYTHIRRGNPPSPEELQDLINRYEAVVGGFFPLRRNTDRQVQGLQRALDEAFGPGRFVCYQGLKHARPFIEDGVQAMADDGIRHAVGVVLAPHYSVMSVGGYIKRAQEKADALGVRMAFVRSYHDHPLLIEAHAERLQRQFGFFAPDVRDDVLVLFSAHSLPERILQMNDPYQDQLLTTARLVAEKAGATRWRFAWQSAGRTKEPWLGPDILDVLRSLHQEGVQRVVVCPIGFVSDHLEILYDIDIECRRLADSLGMNLRRTAMLNTDPKYMKLLTDVVHQASLELGVAQ